MLPLIERSNVPKCLWAIFVGRPILNFLGFQAWKLKKNGEKERDLERKKKITLRKQNRTKEKEDLAFCFGGSQLVRSRKEITVPG